MTAPNLLSPTSITGKSLGVALSTTSATSILSNAVSSNKALKVNSLIVANIDTANAVDVTVNFYSAAALGGTAYGLAKTVSVPAKASLVVIDRATAIYLEENESLGAIAATANKLEIVCSYEEIS